MDRAGWSYPSGELRVSDADRDRALSELTEAFQAGRITPDEFDERSGQALRARTGRELTALLADLPVADAPVARATAPDRAHRLLVTRVGFTAALAAVCFTVVAAGSALSHGPTPQQRELVRQISIRTGMPVPPGINASPGFDWAGTITPAAIAVLLVVLIICLRVHLARAGRH